MRGFGNRSALLSGVLLGLGCISAQNASAEYEIVVSVAEQKLALVKDGAVVKKYAVSTSRFGLGDNPGSYKTPLGRLRVWDKAGGRLVDGAVLKNRQATGEVLRVNAPGRDPIVTRILCLEGIDASNQNARSRGIYIHGTPQESRLGKPVSYGCIRMRSRDVMEVYQAADIGTSVSIIKNRLPRFRRTPLPQSESTPPSEATAASGMQRVSLARRG